ncbi:MAG: hypothetical protein Q9164_005374 [Protoblastenia rupestris]
MATRIATLDATNFIPQSTLRDRLPIQATTLFEAKAAKNMTFEQIGKEIGRNEVAVAAIFYGQAQTTPEDVASLAKVLAIDHGTLEKQLAGFPLRGQTMDMPPKDPLIYRLYEIVQNYGFAYKAIMNEKFGDGIMSAIAFSTKVEKETDKDGNNWAVITLRGKWMGQTQSKRVSNTSTIALLSPTPPVTSSFPTSPAWPDSPYSLQSFPESDITPPAPPRPLHRLSDIIDPRTVLEDVYSPLNTPTRPRNSRVLSNSSRKKPPFSGRGIIQSPSGNTLGAHEFIAHPNRPLAMWERQERVLQATREGMERLEAASRAETRTGRRSREGKNGEGFGRRWKERRCCGWCSC